MFLASLTLGAACKKSTVAESSTAADASVTADPPAEACPKDDVGSVGKKCPRDGQTCGTNSAGFTHFIMCSGGKWVEMNAPPPPH